MFLSNRLAPVLILLFACVGAPGCTWLSSGETPASALQVVEPPKSEIPFETKEPDTFQADFITTAAGSEMRTHFARKGTNWRADTYNGTALRNSIISTDKRIYIDHTTKTYAEAPSGGGPADRPAFINDLTQTLLSRKEHAKFEKLGTDGTLERYRVTVENSTTPWIITYDTSIKMVTRQEPENAAQGGFVFEVRQFTLDVSDTVFQLPAGYRKVDWKEYSKNR